MKATDVELLRQQRKAKKKTKKQKREAEDTRHEELVKNHKEKRKAIKAAKENDSLTKANVDGLPSITTNREKIIAKVSQNKNNIFEAIEGGVHYEALVNDQKKLKYVFNNSKKIMGKRQSDGTYKWRGCK